MASVHELAAIKFSLFFHLAGIGILSIGLFVCSMFTCVRWQVKLW